MNCNLKKFNAEQIAKCKLCKHASANVKHPSKLGWCGFHAVHVDDKSKKKMPPLITQAKNFTTATKKHVAAGRPKRSELETAKCMATCEKCEWFNPDSRRCSKCGCRMTIKSRWATANCPIGKW